MVDRKHRRLSVARQCILLGIGRSSVYYWRSGVSQMDLTLMGVIDRQYLKTPFYGSRKMAVWLKGQGRWVNRKRVQRLMRTMGLQTIYRKPKASRPHPENKVYPYLLRDVPITRPNQVWAADVTYIPMARGFLYPSASLSNCLECQEVKA